jgi:hypothetical protein
MRSRMTLLKLLPLLLLFLLVEPLLLPLLPESAGPSISPGTCRLAAAAATPNCLLAVLRPVHAAYLCFVAGDRLASKAICTCCAGSCSCCSKL